MSPGELWCSCWDWHPWPSRPTMRPFVRPSSDDPNGWTDLLAKAGPKLEGWARGPLPAQGKLVPSRSGLWMRRPDIWSARGTAAMSGSAGTRSWATSSTTSNGDSRRFRARKATTRASMPAIRPMPGSITRPRPATGPAGTCSAPPRAKGHPSGSTCPNSSLRRASSPPASGIPLKSPAAART